jgi:Domain of unknown function (DUF4198)
MKQLLFLILCMPNLAVAHTLTINFATQPPQIALAHNGAFDPVPANRVTQVMSIDKRGRPLVSTALSQGSGTALSVTGNESAGAVWISYAGPPSGTAPTGERRVGPRGTHADATNIAKSQVYAIAVHNAETPLGRLPLGRLSLLPMTSLRQARAGSNLRFKVRYAGAPLPNATIRLDALNLEQGGPTVTTNANGEADVPFSVAGRYLFAVSFVETPSSDVTVDTLRLQASFGFEILPTR